MHNALLLDGPERTVVRGPFHPAPQSVLHGEMALSPKPPWFVTHRTAATTGRLIADFAAANPLDRAAEDPRLRAARLIDGLWSLAG